MTEPHPEGTPEEHAFFDPIIARLERAVAMAPIERAYFDGYRNGLSNEVDDWNKTADEIMEMAKSYAAEMAAKLLEPEPPVHGETWNETQERRRRNLDAEGGEMTVREAIERAFDEGLAESILGPAGLLPAAEIAVTAAISDTRERVLLAFDESLRAAERRYVLYGKTGAILRPDHEE